MQGRWKCKEHFIYLDVIRHKKEQKEIIQELSKRLTERSLTQIRAHHQKMLNKFDSIENILSFYPDVERNRDYEAMTQLLEEAMKKMCSIKTNLDRFFNLGWARIVPFLSWLL